MMICPNCGHAAKETDRFCVKCATKLVDESAEAAAVNDAAEAVEAFAEPYIQHEETDAEVRRAEAVFEEPIAAAEPLQEQFAPVEPSPAPVFEPSPAPVFEPSPAPVLEPSSEPVAAPECEPECTCSATDKPLTTWGFVWRILLFMIPIFNMIPLFVFAFASGINKNSRGLARAVLLLMLISLIICLIGAAILLVVYNGESIWGSIRSFFMRGNA